MPAGDLVDPRQHARRGGFAVRSGNDQRLLPGQKLFMNNLRQRCEGNPLIEHVFKLDITARHGIADDHEVGRGSRFFSEKGSAMGMFRLRSRSDMGGYAA